MLCAASTKAQPHAALPSELEALALVGSGLLLIGVTLRRVVPKQAFADRTGAVTREDASAIGSGS